MKKAILIVIMVLIAVSVNAKEITLVAGLSLPPYIIQDTNNGLEHDIIKEALSVKGHTLTLKYVPFVRVAVDYKNHDGAITINESSGVTGNYSDTVVTYQNYGISLKEKNIAVNSVADLKGKKIVAFQNATKYLGPEFAEAVMGNSKYSEQPKQALQIKMLYSGRSDVIVSDINIFKYYKNQIKDFDTSKPIVLHEIFDGVDYKVLFNDASLRDDFNFGLKSIKDSGRYNEIITSYIK